jgi:hypothetical protein
MKTDFFKSAKSAARRFATSRAKLCVFLTLLLTAGWMQANVPVRDWWGIELALEPAAVFSNPGCLGFHTRPVLMLGMGGQVLDEERTRLVYDRFENTIGEAVYADNINFNWHFGPVAGIYRFRNFGFGAGVAPVRDFGYRYLKEQLDDFYVKIGEDRVEQTGELYSASAGLSFNPINRLCLGAGGRYLFGSRQFEQMIIRIPDTVRVQSSGKPRGAGWLAGVGIALLPELQLNFGYQSAVRLRNWDSTVTRIEPWRALAGAEFRAAGVLPSKFRARAALTGWSAADAVYRNVLSVRLGVEHLLLNSVRLSYGFGLEPLFVDVMVQLPVAEFGLGFDVQQWHLDLGLNASRAEFGASHFVLPIEPEDSRVYQTRVGLNLSMKYEF